MALDGFIELEHGKYITLDLHGMSVQDAYGELIYAINNLDANCGSILVVHGFNLGTTLKNYIRNQFVHSAVVEKINIDAGRTLLKIKK
ncbi:MAG: Smr/MutS family protein [Clostridia bacterium]|nr:Smr/MutS family protein [Clostridia bacterium]